jgi:ubiquinone/menaquinone biosynthesis C-methylase UbiE
MIKDKQIIINEYNKHANHIIKKKIQYQTISYLNSQNEYYFSLFKKLSSKKKILEIGAGTGENTKKLLQMNFNVHAIDISAKSVEAMNIIFSKYKNFSSKVADMEKLPFDNESFDIICSANSLSYGNHNLVMDECYRVLKKKGYMIIMDSLNNNIIFKLNRYLKYLAGHRTKSTIDRIPDINLIDRYIEKFGYGKVKYFGSITWAFPFLSKIMSEIFIKKFSNWIDRKLNVKKSAFKFVLILKKINKC